MVVEIYCLDDRIFRIVIHSGKWFWLSILGMIEFNLQSFEFEPFFREECDQLITNTVTSSAVCLDYSYAKDWFISLCALAGNHVQCLTRLFCLRFDLGHAARQCHISEIYSMNQYYTLWTWRVYILCCYLASTLCGSWHRSAQLSI